MSSSGGHGRIIDIRSHDGRNHDSRHGLESGPCEPLYCVHHGPSTGTTASEVSEEPP